MGDNKQIDDSKNVSIYAIISHREQTFLRSKNVKRGVLLNTVIFAEKPSQAKAYAQAFSVQAKHKTHIELQPCETFPGGAVITWGIGHLVELKEPKEYNKEWAKWNLASLPIAPNKYEYKVSYGKREQFDAIKKLFKDPRVTTIINACDCDREGSNIFYSIFYMTGVKNKVIKRLWINSLEVDEVRKGFQQLHSNEKDLLLYYEAKTRQVSDWLVGMNGSRLYTLLLQQKGFNESLSIGRVQSPTVYLIYQRQLEIERFKPEPFYEIEGLFQAENGKYKGKVKFKSNKREEALELLQKHQVSPQDEGFIESIKRQKKYIKSPKLHALSTLQSVANKKWRYSPANVLKTVQQLYEKKLVTYPRTDTQYITKNEFSYLVNNIEKMQAIAGVSFPVQSKQPKKRYVDDAKVQEHYAIVPTKSIPTEKKLQGLSNEERNIYFEILRTTLAMFHDDYVYEETKVKTNVHELLFETTGKTEISKGWKELFPQGSKKKKEDDSLPILSEQERVQAQINIAEGMTTPPKPYTEGQLINMMKTCGKVIDNEEEMEILKEVEGIGTEATRSGIIETIKKHGYITVTKNTVSITKKGIVLCEAIEGNLLSSPAMTAKWETYLKKIGNGEGSPKFFIESVTKFIEKLLVETPKLIGETKIEVKPIATCPTCKKGKIIARKSYYVCTEQDQGCKQTFPGMLLGKKLTETNVRDLCSKRRTNIIKGFKSKNKKKFNAILTFKNEKIEFEFLNKQS